MIFLLNSNREWTILLQKYAVVHIALIHGTTNKRGGQVTPSKIEFCTCAFYQQKIRIQHKIFYTISPNTSTTWYRYKNTKRIWYTMNQTMNTQFYNCRKIYSNYFYYQFFWLLQKLIRHLVVLSYYHFMLLCYHSKHLFCVLYSNFFTQFEKSSPYLSRKSGFVENFNTQKPKFSER